MVATAKYYVECYGVNDRTEIFGSTFIENIGEVGHFCW